MRMLLGSSLAPLTRKRTNILAVKMVNTEQILRTEPSSSRIDPSTAIHSLRACTKLSETRTISAAPWVTLPRPLPPSER